MIQITDETIDQLLGARLTPDQTSQHPNHLQDLVDGSLIEREDGNPSPDELRRQVGLEVRKGEDTVVSSVRQTIRSGYLAGISHSVNSKSANTKPSRSTTTPGAMGTFRPNIGPA